MVCSVPGHAHFLCDSIICQITRVTVLLLFVSFTFSKFLFVLICIPLFRYVRSSDCSVRSCCDLTSE